MKQGNESLHTDHLPHKKLVYAFGAIKLVIHLKEDAIKFEHKNPIPLSKRFSLFFATKRKV